ncbi:MAG: hypothetical protein KGL52_15690 [Rhodospirillales bacterium]|jgi:hypothetical protein|nr:hypothetical protein [Rhodospirillales bacterium]
MAIEPSTPDPTPSELSHAGAVVDKAIEYMAGQNVPPLAIASALLGGAVTLLAHHVSDAAIIRVLDNAIEGVRSGELRQTMQDGA